MLCKNSLIERKGLSHNLFLHRVFFQSTFYLNERFLMTYFIWKSLFLFFPKGIFISGRFRLSGGKSLDPRFQYGMQIHRNLLIFLSWSPNVNAYIDCIQTAFLSSHHASCLFTKSHVELLKYLELITTQPWSSFASLSTVIFCKSSSILFNNSTLD